MAGDAIGARRTPGGGERVRGDDTGDESGEVTGDRVGIAIGDVIGATARGTETDAGDIFCAANVDIGLVGRAGERGLSSGERRIGLLGGGGDGLFRE